MRVFHFGLSAHSKTSWDVAVEFSVAILRFVKCQHVKSWKRGTWVGMKYSCFYLSRVKILLHKIHRVQWVETRNESTESSPFFPPVFSGTVHVSLRRVATLHSLISWVPFLLLVFYPHHHFCPLSPFPLFTDHSMGRMGRAQAAWLTALNWNPYSATSSLCVSVLGGIYITFQACFLISKWHSSCLPFRVIMRIKWVSAGYMYGAKWN